MSYSSAAAPGRNGTFALLGVAVAAALLAQPASAGAVRVVGSLSQERPARPGEEYTHSITLVNGGATPGQVKLYLRDYSCQSDGSNQYAEPGSTARSNATWIRLPSEVVEVPAGGRLEVPIFVAVPADAALDGTYWSMLMVEPVGDGDPLSGAAPAHGVAVRTVMRYGVQIVTEIPGSASGQLEFFAPSMLQQDGKWVFTIDARNSGQGWLRPKFQLELFDQSGALAGRFEDSRKRIYPGSSVRFRTVLGALPPGTTYHALAVADSGTQELFGVTLDLVVR